MAEHYLRGTVEASAWCSKCRRETMHRIDGVKKGPCKVCMAKLEAQPRPKPPAQQDRLF